jgi:hypothetical protein
VQTISTTSCSLLCHGPKANRIIPRHVQRKLPLDALSGGSAGASGAACPSLLKWKRCDVREVMRCVTTPPQAPHAKSQQAGVQKRARLPRLLVAAWGSFARPLRGGSATIASIPATVYRFSSNHMSFRCGLASLRFDGKSFDAHEAVPRNASMSYGIDLKQS